MKHSINLSALITFILLCFAMQGYSQSSGPVSLGTPTRPNNGTGNPNNGTGNCEERIDTRLINDYTIHITTLHAQSNLIAVSVVNTNTGEFVLRKRISGRKTSFDASSFPVGHYHVIATTSLSICDPDLKNTYRKMIIHY